MTIYYRKREPVIGIRFIGCCTKCLQQVRICRICKTRRNNKTIERAPVKRSREHVRGDKFAGYATIFDIPVKVLFCLPDKPGTTIHPLITPTGERRATSFEIPSSWTTFTTSSLD